MNKLDNLSNWKVFLSLSETKNFQATADFFETDASTVSRNINGLEKLLGQKLFLRKKRPLQLTPVGEKARKLMEGHLRRHQQIMTELQSDNAVLEGEIKVSVAQGLSLRMIGLISEFQSYYPEVTFKLVGQGTVRDIESNLADIACITGESRNPEVFLIPRKQVSYASIASPSYVERKGLPATPKDLRGHIIYQYEGEHRISPNIMTNGEEKVDISGNKIMRLSDILTIKNAVLDGFGICLDMPLPLCSSELEQGRLVRILTDWLIQPMPTFIAIHQNLLTSRRHRIFAYWLRDKLAELDR